MILVTGATGLVGTHIIIELLKRGEKVRAFVRDSSSKESLISVFNYYFAENTSQMLDKIEWAQGNILDIMSLEKAVQNCTAVYHCAALVSFRRNDFNRLIKINKEGTANVVNVCLSAGVDHLCYISSTATIGRSAEQSLLDESSKFNLSEENSGYAVSKHLAEMEVWRGIEEGLRAVIINPCVIFGPGNWNTGSLSIFRSVRNGLRFYSPGSNAFVDARDVATVVCELASRRIFNDRFLVTGDNLSYKNLFYKIADAFNTKRPAICARPWMASLYWRIQGVVSFFTGRKPTVTRQTAKSAMINVAFSNQKICTRLDFKFRPIDETINHAVNYFRLGHIYNQKS